MSMFPELSILFSKEFEKDRVLYTLQKRNWYREHGFNPRIPNEKRIADIDSNDSFDDFLVHVEEEYDEDFFITLEASIKEKWSQFGAIWNKRVDGTSPISFLPSYILQLTRYGMGGSYDLPNFIYLNVEGKDPELCVSITFHEMIHLSIEPLVQKYKTPHFKKERIVDLYFNTLFPETNFEETSGKNDLHAEVDPIFQKHFNNPEELFKCLK